MMAHPPPSSGRTPEEEWWRNATGGNSDAATVATAGAAVVEVAAKMVGVATTTTTAGVTSVVEAGEVHRMLVVAEDAAEGATLLQQPGLLAEALAVATEGGGISREDVQRGTAPTTP